MRFVEVKTLLLVACAIVKDCCAPQPVTEPYVQGLLYKTHAGYGDGWMYFPDGDGEPHVAILNFPAVDDKSKFFVNVEESVSFTLYTREKTKGEVLTTEEGSIELSDFDFGKETKFVTHGWMSSGNSSTCQRIKDAYLQNFDYNVVVMDWSPIANNLVYPFPAFNTENVAVHLAKFLDYLICKGYVSNKIHVIGHSLGAHVAGIAGTKNNGRLGRVTGLDPANPIFNFGFLQTLSIKSAQFVDVIHTSSGIIGMGSPLGHADFYPNGGSPPQPGCFGLTEFVEGCSHASSWKYYVRTVLNRAEYLAYRCATYRDYESGVCRKNGSIYMGEGTPESARGSYYLSTGTV